MSLKYYLTTPLYYVNSKPHIGHSYTNVACDALARFWRLSGRDVLFLTGTDEHGQKIDKAAREAGMNPQAFTDEISKKFRDLWSLLNISFDDYIRTTEPRHVQAVEEVWRVLLKKGEIYKDKYSGWYCTPCETFWTQGQVLAEGAQNLCPDCRRPVEHLEEENYFLKISAHQAWLIETIRQGKSVRILPETRRNEVLGFLENNTLQDLCISRPKSRLSWGIAVPISPDHVTYVWFDALINYISAVGYGLNEELFSRWWPADAHVIGKDILRHHAVYWTILLHALDLPLPKMIFAHGWWLQDGDKMSKSRGNVTDPAALVGSYGVDAYRYFLLSETPFGEDGTFSEAALVKRYNSDLANDLGNLVSRSLAMTEKYFGGTISPGDPFEKFSDNKQPIVASARELQRVVNGLPARMTSWMEKLAFDRCLEEIWQVINLANKFVDLSAPWTLAKEKREDELKLAMTTLLETIRMAALAVWPFMPHTAETIWKQLGIPGEPHTKTLQNDSWGYFAEGGRVAKGAPLFPRIEWKPDAS